MAKNFSIKHQPGFTAIAATCFIVLYLPIIVLVIYAFNAASSTSEWGGFSLKWFQSAWQNTQVVDATLRSFQIGSIAAVLSTTFATMAALATTRTAPYP
ncbi:MAG: spermidine/putrescine ABC transporter permease PotC, partial [Mesorhizobium sp.]